MSHLQGPHFSTAEFEAIPELEAQLLQQSPNLREAVEFKAGFLDQNEYLEWLMGEVTHRVYKVTNHSSPRRERGSGGRKAGAHSEGKHR